MNDSLSGTTYPIRSHPSLLLKDMLPLCFHNPAHPSSPASEEIHQVKVVLNCFHTLNVHTVQEAILQSVVDPDFMRTLGSVLCNVTADALIACLSGLLVPESYTCSILHESRSQDVSCGCHAINRWLGGGFRRQYITELSGEASTGKTCLALQTVAHLLAHSSSCIIYFAVEPLPHDRLLELLDEEMKRSKYGTTMDVLNRMIVNRVHDLDTMLHALESVPKIAAALFLRHHCPLSLIVLDSITALESGPNDRKRKADAFPIHTMVSSSSAVHVGRVLRRLAHELDVAIVVTNQVRMIENYKTVPALGMAWIKIPHVRVMFRRHVSGRTPQRIDSDNLDNKRSLSLVFSSYCATDQTMEVRLTRRGIYTE